MSGFSQIDLSKLPAPELVEVLDFDAILSAVTERFKADNPVLSESLNFESEPITALNQAWAYRELMLRDYINASMRGMMLAFSSGGALDQLAALTPTLRKDGETDDAFRSRVQLAPEAFSTAGPDGAYIFHAKSASADIIDVYVPAATLVTAGQVNVYVLTQDDADVPATLQLVRDALSNDTRPLTDFVSVQEAARVDYSIDATLSMNDGPDSSVVVAAARDSALSYVASRLLFGKPIYRTALAAALVVSGVENVVLNSPAQDVIVAPDTVARLISISVTEASDV